MDESDHPLVSDKFGNFHDSYTRHRSLAQTGPTRTFLCRANDSSELVHVRQVQKEYFFSKGSAVVDRFVQRQQEEIEAMCELSSEDGGLVDLIEDRHYLYVVTEWHERSSLADYLRETPMSEASTSILIEGLLNVVGNLHRLGITHANITPRTIFIDKTSDDGSLKVQISPSFHALSPFRVADPWQDWQPWYSAPETFAGELTNKADMWSVGIITYAVLFRYLPFGTNETWTVDEVARVLAHGFDPRFHDGAGAWFPTETPISREGRSFIAGLLSDIPVERSSITEALSSEWIQGKPPSVLLPIDALTRTIDPVTPLEGCVRTFSVSPAPSEVSRLSIAETGSESQMDKWSTSNSASDDFDRVPRQTGQDTSHFGGSQADASERISYSSLIDLDSLEESVRPCRRESGLISLPSVRDEREPDEKRESESDAARFEDPNYFEVPSFASSSPSIRDRPFPEPLPRQRTHSKLRPRSQLSARSQERHRRVNPQSMGRFNPPVDRDRAHRFGNPNTSASASRNTSQRASRSNVVPDRQNYRGKRPSRPSVSGRDSRRRDDMRSPSVDGGQNLNNRHGGDIRDGFRDRGGQQRRLNRYKFEGGGNESDVRIASAEKPGRSRPRLRNVDVMLETPDRGLMSSRPKSAPRRDSVDSSNFRSQEEDGVIVHSNSNSINSRRERLPKDQARRRRSSSVVRGEDASETFMRYMYAAYLKTADANARLQTETYQSFINGIKSPKSGRQNRDDDLTHDMSYRGRRQASTSFQQQDFDDDLSPSRGGDFIDEFQDEYGQDVNAYEDEEDVMGSSASVWEDGIPRVLFPSDDDVDDIASPRDRPRQIRHRRVRSAGYGKYMDLI